MRNWQFVEEFLLYCATLSAIIEAPPHQNHESCKRSPHKIVDISKIKLT